MSVVWGKTAALSISEEAAWQLYCKETAGDMDVRDYWEQLPIRVQAHYLTKVYAAKT